MSIKRIATVTAALALALGLAACGSDDDSGSAPEGAGVAEQEQAPDNSPADGDASPDDDLQYGALGPDEYTDYSPIHEDDELAVIHFDTGYRWPDGQVLEVDKVGGSSSDDARIVFQYTNGSDVAVNTSSPGVSVACGGEDSELTAGEEGDDRNPDEMVPPDGEAQWVETYRAELTDLCSVTVMPDLDSKAVVWTDDEEAWGD